MGVRVFTCCVPVSTLLSTSATKVLIPTPYDVMTLSSQSLQHYCNYSNFKLNSTKRHQLPTNGSELIPENKGDQNIRRQGFE